MGQKILDTTLPHQAAHEAAGAPDSIGGDAYSGNTRQRGDHSRPVYPLFELKPTMARTAVPLFPSSDN